MSGASVEDRVESPLSGLSEERLDQLARELDAIYDRVRADLGERDRRYIERMIGLHRRLAVVSRALLLAASNGPARAAGTAALSAAKILENMEIGHNVLHGQWDWMNDPRIHSTTWDWDTASTAEAWKHSHNYVHHTFTNIRGKDKDLGYEIMRIDPQQRWHPIHLLQPFYNLIVMGLFEWGIAFHDLDLVGVRKGTKSMSQVRRELIGIREKAKSQVVKDYIAWPLLSGLAATVVALARDGGGGRGHRRRSLRRALAKGTRTYGATAKANATANVARNVWAYAIIFCGHFPDQTYTFSQSEVQNETPGAHYVRQLSGSANIEGGPFFHIASGNLGFQVEHHLFPDLPSSRYVEIAPEVRDICERYGLPYNSGPFLRQLAMTQRTILRLAFPGGKQRPKPGPYRGEVAAASVM